MGLASATYYDEPEIQAHWARLVEHIQGLYQCFGAVAPGVARGLKLRHAHGSNYIFIRTFRPSIPSKTCEPHSSCSPHTTTKPGSLPGTAIVPQPKCEPIIPA